MDIKILQNIPNKPWIYLFKGKKDNFLYIWKAKNLKNRVSQYFNPNSVRKQDMLNQAIDIDFLQVKTESEALYLEDNLIKKHQPPFNNMLKWSNSYAYIKITNEDFPQIFITRNKIKDGATYIWPKHNTRNLKDFLQYLRYILKRRWCKKTEFNKWKLCSDYHFGLCRWRCLAEAPIKNSLLKDSYRVLSCNKNFKSPPRQVGELLWERSTKIWLMRKDYSNIIKMIEQFFKWNIKPVEKEIKTQIKLAWEKHNFERAAKLRDIYLKIESITEQQTVVLPKSISGYFCQTQEISGRLVYIILNFYEWKIIDVIINKQKKDDLDEKSLKSILELELGDLQENKINDKILFFNKSIKLNKSSTQDIINLANWFLESYIISESFKDDNLINDLLVELQSKYFLKNFPYHMECIDISHFGWQQTSGGLSGFLWWIPNYKLYRRYKIEKKINKNLWDDYDSLKEVIIKRFKDKQDLPDLFVLDWWKGQLGILKDLLQEDWFKQIFDKVDFVSLGKWSARKAWWKLKWEKEKIFYFDQDLKIKSLDLSYDQSDQLLIKLRDEAHRFANSYRKKQDKNNLVKS